MVRTLSELIAEAVSRQPDKCAVTHKKHSMTYAEIYGQSCRLAASLREMGVRRGDRVCCYLEKRLEKVIVFFGVSLAGAVFVPVRGGGRPYQVLHVIENCDAGVLITTAQKFSLLQELPASLYGAVILDRSGNSFPASLTIRFWNEMADDREKHWPLPVVIAQDLAAILYTSGSSGRPKGVVLTHGNIIAGAYSVAEYLKIDKNDRLLSYLSFGFDYGLNQLTTSFLSQAQLILFDYLFPRDILRAVEQHQVTGLAAVSATWIQLLQIPWGDACSSLRYVTNSGGALPVGFVKELRQRIPQADIFLMYGLTEAFRSTYLDPEMVDKRPGSIGKAVPGEEIMVLDSNNRPVKPGETGELVHRGSLVAMGYWNDAEKTRQMFRPYPFQNKDAGTLERVVYSGDYVHLDSEGFLYFEGRKDAMIKTAGNRVSPTEVEEVVYSAGIVADVVAFGVSHEIYGQAVCIVVSALEGVVLSKENLKGFCRENMPAYMVPTHIQILDMLPRNANGKLDRTLIMEQFFSRESSQ